MSRGLAEEAWSVVMVVAQGQSVAVAQGQSVAAAHGQAIEVVLPRSWRPVDWCTPPCC